jgi:Cu(I)/Ag(I) efflux system membrane fusion protein
MLGAESGDQVEVLQGVEAGERVVTRANFLVDSESRLRASLAAMGGK